MSDEEEEEFGTNKPRHRAKPRAEIPEVVTMPRPKQKKKGQKSSNFADIKKLHYRKREAAYALGLSVRSIDAMIADQRLTTRRFGRCVMIPAADVERAAKTIIRSDMLEGVSPKVSSA